MLQNINYIVCRFGYMKESHKETDENKCNIVIDDKITLATYNGMCITPQKVKKMFPVWIEGYAISGNRSGAIYLGECLAYTFLEACEILSRDTIDRNTDGSIVVVNGYATDWGRRFFNNGIDARKSFG